MTRFVGELFGPDERHLRAQPAPEEYGGCRVLCRGFIANRQTLVDEGRRRGESLVGRSAAELFVAAYRWWGEGLQSRVTGEYAVAIFDARDSCLFLTHDALGIVPLFYSLKTDGFAFASHLEDLIRPIGFDDVDPQYVADYLTFGTALGARTPHRSIRRLLPGESVYRRGLRVSVLKTWDLARIEPASPCDDVEYEERFRELLREAVTSALPEDGGVWAELSGGLDSSSVVSAAAALAAKRLDTVSLVLRSSRSIDESEWMQTVVRRFSLRWHTLDADESRPFSELPDRFFAEPTTALPAVGLFKRYKALADSHAVGIILSGYGGDQVCFGGSPKPYYLADYLPFHPRRLGAELRAWQAVDAEQRSLIYLLLKNAVHPHIRHLMGLCLTATPDRIPPWLGPDTVRAVRLSNEQLRTKVINCRLVGERYLKERIWCAGAMRAATCDQDLYPLEFRYPLLYRPLVEFMLSLPQRQKFGPGDDRSLQRRALKGILPEEVRQRRDKGAMDEAYFEGLRTGSAWTSLLLNQPLIVDLGYADGAAWEEAVTKARYGCVQCMKQFIAAATLEVWLRQLDNGRRDGSLSLLGSLPREESRVS